MTQVDAIPYIVSGQEKITAHHLERLAYIYIRQSSPGQVVHNPESQVNQMRMAERTEALGWPTARIRLISSDQGITGKYSSIRGGFKTLLSEVALGRVGIIFGYEVARLARNNSDLYRLLEPAAIFDTLIADYDGIYDLRLVNDRLLLGLKGTMSEAELHLLHLRLHEGRMRQIERGEYRQCLPTGLVRLSDGTVVKDPDDQVRHTLELIFAKFDELGTARKVLTYLREQDILLPRYQFRGPYAGQVIWKVPTHGTIYAILTNPAYAGAFVFGRKQQEFTSTYVDGNEYPQTRRVWQPMEAWLHIHHDIYPAYISWETYLSNRERLRRNATFQTSASSQQGAAREGAALLQGMVLCGKCGHRMNTQYKPAPRYECASLSRLFGEPFCDFIGAPAVDAAVVQAFFEAIRPANLDVLEAVLAEQEVERATLARQWDERLKRAQYVMDST